MFSFGRLLLIVSVLLPFCLADNLFAGCYATVPGGSVPPSGQPLRRSSAHCSAGCTANTHSYFNATSGQCFCSNGTPFSRDLVLGNQDACGPSYDNRVLRSSFMSLNPQCFSAPPPGINAGNTRQLTGLNGCLNSCKNDLRAWFWANSAANNYFCSCLQPVAYGNGASCGPQSVFGYYHTAEAAASGLTRRRQREEAASKAAAKLSFCPQGWTACNVPGAEDCAYECIDVTKELDSCGGCMYGQHYAPNATVGQDCTKMPNTARGGSTCLNGKCQAFACGRGYKSVDGQCIRR